MKQERLKAGRQM